MKVAFLTNIVSPYRAPVFQSLAKTQGWDLRVYVNARTEFDRKWSGNAEGVDIRVSRSISKKIVNVTQEPLRIEQVTTRHIPVGLPGDLIKWRPNVIITHELGPRSTIAASWSRMTGCPLVLWSYQCRAVASYGGKVRQKVRRFVLNTADAVLGMGVQAREVLEGYGCSPDKIVDAPNSTDDTMIRNRIAQKRADGTVDRLRAEIGEGKRVLAVVGRLIPLKGIVEVLAAWKQLPDSLRDQWRLVFVGDGPLEPLVTEAYDLGVRHVKEVPMEDVATYFGIADLHLFASFTDVWGLTVNEAMICGVPTLCSVHAGCADDLVVPGRNGDLFDPSNADVMVDVLARTMSSPDLEAWGRNAARDSEDCSIERLAEGFREAVKRAVSKRRPSLAMA